jgi:uncharacterized membrane protein YuzA (DUF378 family)
MDNTRTEVGQAKPLNVLAAILLIVGGLNWGLVAIAEFDLVAWLFGEEFGATNVVTRIVYGLVGLAAVYGIAALLGRRQTTPARRPSPAAQR